MNRDILVKNRDRQGASNWEKTDRDRKGDRMTDTKKG